MSMDRIPDGMEVILSIHGVPWDIILESFFKLRIRECYQLKTVLAFNEQDIEQKIHSRAARG